MDTQGTDMLRFLVADDNSITLDFLASALRQLGWQAVAVGDGAAAAERAASERFDVLLLDARMPILDGAAALRKIRAEPGKSTHAPALATTASTDRDRLDALFAAGFDAVLPKPITIVDLGNSLRRYDCRDGDAANAFFDEARALAVVGGDAGVVKALRGLLLAELDRLPGELALMSRQLNANQQLDERLHRLAASAGFCGAVALEEAVRALEAAQKRQAGWPGDEVAMFTKRCEQIEQQLRVLMDDENNL
ncbi:MAG: response regulator [Dokdonella sp.]